MAASEDFRSQLPFCLLTDDGLSANPGLADLLMDLKKYIDYSGMSITLAQPLEEARKRLKMYRANWFQWRSLYVIVLKIVLRLRDGSSFEDQKFLETLERQVTVYQLVLHLSQPKPFVLGLETQHLTKFLPRHRGLEQMQKKLQAEVKMFLKGSCLLLLGYYCPKSEKVGAATQKIMFGKLAERLAIEKQRLKEARAKEEKLNRCLEQVKEFHCQILLRSLGALRQLAHKFRLEDQSKLDKFKVQYLAIKSSAFLLKIWVEEMRMLLEMYTPEVINVHRMLRDRLEGTLSKEEKDLVLFRKFLLHFEIQGPEFEKLVDKYSKLRENIQRHQWILAELDKY